MAYDGINSSSSEKEEWGLSAVDFETIPARPNATKLRQGGEGEEPRWKLS